MVHPAIANITQKLFRKLGYEIWHISRDYSKQDIEIMNYARPFTLTNDGTMKSLIDAVRYIEENQIEGTFVECGVWKGGSIVIMVKTLQELGITDRDFYLFDTFEGMSKPTKHDIAVTKEIALSTYNHKYDYIIESLDQVKKVVFATGYDKSRFHFIKGKVEDTLPKNCPDKISLLRLDTDWYESTKQELESLFPLLSSGGILIIDDYGVWRGAKKATDEYFEKNKVQIHLNRIHPLGAVRRINQKYSILVQGNPLNFFP